jgi:hypothetical protein
MLPFKAFKKIHIPLSIGIIFTNESFQIRAESLKIKKVY